MYRLDNRFAEWHFTVSIVGCGGTGGFVAEGLCRLLPSEVRLALLDHDRVEERNLGRQNFLPEELGQFKSEALAMRLARKYGRPVAYTTRPVSLTKLTDTGLVISCVDNGPARRDIARMVANYSYSSRWWVDAGNGENYGQVLIGNVPLQRLPGAFDPKKGVCYTLPLPTLQRPELLAQLPPVRDCAGAVAAGEQGPAINQAIAALVVEMARRLIDGSCPWMGLYLDMEAGTLLPVQATPEAVERVTRVDQRHLVKERR